MTRPTETSTIERTTSYPKHKIRFVLLEGIHPAAGEQLERDGFTVEQIDGSLSEAALAEAVRDAHVIGIRSKTQIDATVLAHAQKLLAVGCFCIGTNQVDLASAAARGIPVYNSPFSNTRSVAELVIAEVIALHRKLFDRSAHAHAGRWQKSSTGSHEVRGRTLGIIGYGRIGSQVSVLA
ncbi:MAG: NAD(P)-dependent oxidoreductase, partial [Planctomycetota bacterium]